MVESLGKESDLLVDRNYIIVSPKSGNGLVR